MRFAILAIGILILAGCGWGRGAPQPGFCPGTGSTLVSIGQWSQITGCSAVGIAAIAWVLGIFPATAEVFLPLAKYFIELAAIGIALIVLGTSAIWLGTHTWLMAIVVVLVLAGLGFRYRNRIGRFLGFPRKPPASKVANA